MRNILEPSQTKFYKEHTANITAVRFAKSGKLACSGDEKGFVHVWSTNTLKSLKVLKILSGSVRDICWTGDNKRIAIVGDGKSTKAKCVNVDTGSGLGDMLFHSKNVLCVDFSSEKPWKLITGSEDQAIGLYKGPPFKKGVKIS